MTNYKENFDHLSPVWTHYSDVIVDHGEGTYLYATDGRKFIDFTCGIGVTNTGHCHPKVVEAIRKQAGLLLHGQANLVTHKPMLELVEEMRTIVPASLDGFFFSNSGAEAVEGALKLARHATGRPNVIVFQGSFPRTNRCNHVHDHLQDNIQGRVSTAHAWRFRNALPLCIEIWLG